MGLRGPKGWEPTEEDRKRIRLLAGLGLTQAHIGAVMGCSVMTLAKHCREELDIGKAETIAKVAGSLVKKALNGDTTSAIFYLKTQAGWKETEVREIHNRTTYELDSLTTDRLEQLESILAEASRDQGGAGEEVASSVH